MSPLRPRLPKPEAVEPYDPEADTRPSGRGRCSWPGCSAGPEFTYTSPNGRRKYHVCGPHTQGATDA